MNAAGFAVIAAMIAAYVTLDGWDLGVGAIHLFYAKSDEQRRASMRAIAPFWNGNEVVLIAAGATLFAIFPRAYASAFSGFYLPLIVVLWLLMARGVAMELRDQYASELWRGFWDAAFGVSSALLAFVFGVALGNIVRGVPLDASGYFTGTFGFLLNGYALAVGALALASLALHGANYAALRVKPELGLRTRQTARAMWIASLILFCGVTAATLRAHPLHANPVLWIAPLAALVSLVVSGIAPNDRARFAASSAFLIALVASAAQTIFPYLLPGFPAAAAGLTIYNSVPAGSSMATGIAASVIGCGLAFVYGTIAARRLLAGESRQP